MINLKSTLSGIEGAQLIQHTTNIVLNGASGAATMVLDTWAGSGILRHAGHAGYGPLAVPQYANAALIGIPAGATWYCAKETAHAIIPELGEAATSTAQRATRFAAELVLSAGLAALVDVVAAKTAEHRGDAHYLSPAHGAAASATGDVIVGAIWTGAVFMLVGCCVGSFGTAARGQRREAHDLA